MSDYVSINWGLSSLINGPNITYTDSPTTAMATATHITITLAIYMQLKVTIMQTFGNSKFRKCSFITLFCLFGLHTFYNFFLNLK